MAGNTAGFQLPKDAYRVAAHVLQNLVTRKAGKAKPVLTLNFRCAIKHLERIAYTAVQHLMLHIDSMKKKNL